VGQGRFASCVLDQAHLLAATRYVERNPVRAGLSRRVIGHGRARAAIPKIALTTWLSVMRCSTSSLTGPPSLPRTCASACAPPNALAGRVLTP
jgi:hypothetical protein